MAALRAVIISLGACRTLALLKQDQDKFHVQFMPSDTTRDTSSIHNSHDKFKIIFFAHMAKTASISMQSAFLRFCHNDRCNGQTFCMPRACNGDKNTAWQVCHPGAGIDPIQIAGTAVINAKGERILLGTIVRNPFSQMISLFFQRVGSGCCGYEGFRKRILAGELSLSDLRYSFERTLVREWFKHYSDWIGALLDIVGIRRKSYRFDAGARRAVVDSPKNNATLLVLRMEDINDWPSLASGYAPEVTMLTHSNDGTDKWYADTYKSFVQTYVFPSSVCDRVKSTDAWGHYSETEQQCLLAVSCGQEAQEARMAWTGSRMYATCGGDRKMFLHDTLTDGLDPDGGDDNE